MTEGRGTTVAIQYGTLLPDAFLPEPIYGKQCVPHITVSSKGLFIQRMGHRRILLLFPFPNLSLTCHFPKAGETVMVVPNLRGDHTTETSRLALSRVSPNLRHSVLPGADPPVPVNEASESSATAVGLEPASGVCVGDVPSVSLTGPSVRACTRVAVHV